MIFDNIKNYKKYENINDNFKKAFEFLKREDLNTLPVGRYEIDENNIFALIQEYETKDIEDKDYEVHRKYIDVQYMLDGQEKMGFSTMDELYIKTPYSDESDAAVLGGEKILFKLRTGEFYVFFPNEPHMPGVKNDVIMKVKKVVVKIKA